MLSVKTLTDGLLEALDPGKTAIRKTPHRQWHRHVQNGSRGGDCVGLGLSLWLASLLFVKGKQGVAVAE